MDRKTKGLLWGLIGLIILVIVLDATADKPVDWTPSYIHTDAKPLGSEVFYQGLQSVAQDLQLQGKSPFDVFQDSIKLSGTYFFLNSYVNITNEESTQLLNWVKEGNTAFIASEGIPKPLLDSLGLDVSFHVSTTEIEYKPSFNLVDKPLQLSSYKTSRKAFEYLYFSKIDSANTKALGLVRQSNSRKNKDRKHTNYITVDWGGGEFLFHLAPQVFSNYFMLDDENSDYTSRTLGYVDLGKSIIWDSYYKAGKEQISNPLYYLLSNPYLKSAYYLVIITSLLFVIFGGKRKQRPIPILPPVENRSYEFAQTIAGMYLDQKDHKAIAQKQITSFLEHIRSTYNLPTHDINSEFLRDLALKTGKTYEDLETLFQYIERIDKAEAINEDDLKTLDKKLTTFNS